MSSVPVKVVDAKGNIHWLCGLRKHRTDGPAVEWASGTKEWYQDDLRHRVDGPAIEYANGSKRWFINGAEMTEAEFNQLVVKMSEVAVFDTLKYRIEVDECGTRRYYNDAGQLHRIDGPAVEMSDGGKSWYQNGMLHRIDGPAYECFDSFRYNSKYWYQNGLLHRIDGPAVERSDDQHYNVKYWYQNGMLHRIDGPAIEDTDGNTAWFINGKSLLEAEFNQAVTLL